MKLKELVNSYEEELGLKGKEFDGTKSKCPAGCRFSAFFFIVSAFIQLISGAKAGLLFLFWMGSK